MSFHFQSLNLNSIFYYRYDKWSQTWDQTLSAILGFAAGIGLTTLGWFEINPNDLKHQIMHYIGFVLCFGAVFGLGFQTWFNVYFWILCILSCIGLSGFVFFIYKSSKILPSTDAEYVNKISKQCIVSESIVLLSGAFASIFVFLKSLNYKLNLFCNWISTVYEELS